MSKQLHHYNFQTNGTLDGFVNFAKMFTISTQTGHLVRFQKLRLFGVIFPSDPSNSYLPGREVNRDHQGGSSRARPFHCTPVGLTPAISPNVGNSTALFMLVGICVRANPCKMIQKTWALSIWFAYCVRQILHVLWIRHLHCAVWACVLTMTTKERVMLWSTDFCR